jgi:hypothetical protein
MTANLKDESQYYAVICIICIRAIGLLVLFSACVYFWVHQHSKYGSLSKMVDNRFVVITLAMVLSLIVAEVMFVPVMCAVYQIGFGTVPTKWNNPNNFTVPICICEVLVLACHVCLLYMRTRPIVQNMKVIQKFIKMIISSFTFFAVVCIVSSFLLLLKTERTNGERNSTFDTVGDAIVVFSAMLCGASMCGMDCVSTYCFLGYVRHTKQALGSQEHVSSIKATYLIAQVGTAICLTSLTGSTVYTSQIFFTDFVAIDAMYLLMSLTMDTISVMWIIMKLKLDHVNLNSGENLKVTDVKVTSSGEVKELEPRGSSDN